MANKRRFVIYLWIVVYTFQTGVCTYNYFSPKTSPGVYPLTNFPAQTSPAKPKFVFKRLFDFEDETKQTTSKITQREKVRFPKLGLVEVRAAEELDKLPCLEFTSSKTKRPIGNFKLGTERILQKGSPNNPFIRFKEMHIKGFPSPIVFAVVAYLGGSGSGYEAYVFGEINGKLKLLSKQRIATSNQGGIFIGNLGRGKGLGIATWDFIWDFDSEGHYSYHQYQIEFYPFDNKTNLFRKGKTIKTKEKYGGRGEEALRELKLPYTDVLQTVPSLDYLKHYKETGF